MDVVIIEKKIYIKNLSLGFRSQAATHLFRETHTHSQPHKYRVGWVNKRKFLFLPHTQNQHPLACTLKKNFIQTFRDGAQGKA